MLELSKQAEMVMIVTGLAAGSIATLLCIAWTCVLLAWSRRKRHKHDDENPPSILPVTTTQQQQQQSSPQSTNSSVLLATLELMRENDDDIPLPPPSNMVPVPCSLCDNPAYSSTNLTTMVNHARKRKLDDILPEPIQVAAAMLTQEPGSWKDFWTIHPPRKPRKRAILHKSSSSPRRWRALRHPTTTTTIIDDNNNNQQEDMLTRATPRWKVYYATKLRRSVSDETCAGTMDVGADASSSSVKNQKTTRNNIPQHV